jgi:hypothetical protein
MTLHPVPSEFPYIWGKFLFSFLSVGEGRRREGLEDRRGGREERGEREITGGGVDGVSKEKPWIVLK